MYVLIGLGVLFIAALVVAYLSARNWHWGQVVVVFMLFAAAVGYSILASDVLRKHDQVRSEYNEVVTELETLTAQNQALLYGTRDSSIYNALAADNIEPVDGALRGIRDLESELSDVLRARGPVWRYIAHPSVDPQTGAVAIRAVPPPAPQPGPDQFGQEPAQPQAPPPASLAGLKEGAIVFAFEQTPVTGPSPGRYLGEFQVTSREGQQATIEPILRRSWAWPPDQQTNERMERLRTSQAPWVLYETMPTDRYDAYAGLSEEELRSLLPEETVDQYIRHGQPVGEEVDPRFKAPYTKDGTPLTEKTLATTDPADVEWRYQRPLRDYTLLFQAIARQRVEEFAEHDALTTDIELVNSANTSAQTLQESRQQEIEKLKHDLAGFSREVEVIEGHVEALQRQIEEVSARIEDLLTQNKSKAGELAQEQLDVIRQLNQTSAATPAGN